MKHKDFIVAIQRRVATVAIGASTVRGQGAPGIVLSVRNYLSKIPLQQFGTKNKSEFFRALNESTAQLIKEIPSPANSWGLARKCLNIFLHDSYYSNYLRNEYNLGESEEFYEVPLDSIIAKKLIEYDSSLPKWKGVKYLQSIEVNNQYQNAASRCAKEKEVMRVHLETIWWSEEPKEPQEE